MEPSSGSDPATPAALSHHVVRPDDQIHGEASAKAASSKQRQRTRRACYPCSKVCVTPVAEVLRSELTTI